MKKQFERSKADQEPVGIKEGSVNEEKLDLRQAATHKVHGERHYSKGGAAFACGGSVKKGKC